MDKSCHSPCENIPSVHSVSYPSGKAPDYWPDYFEDAVQNGMVDWYTGNLYKD